MSVAGGRRVTDHGTDADIGPIFSAAYLHDEKTEPETPVHACPPLGSGIMPCCGKTPFEVDPWKNRLTSDPALVTCGKDA